MGAALLWLILIAKYSIKVFNRTRSKAYSYIFYKKDNDSKIGTRHILSRRRFIHGRKARDIGKDKINDKVEAQHSRVWECE